jgi:hypothetical protein
MWTTASALRRYYIPHAMSAENILYIACVMHNLAETLEANLHAGPGGILIERSIFTAIRAKGQAFADDIDNWITPHDVEGTTDGLKIGVSFYHYAVLSGR